MISIFPLVIWTLMLFNSLSPDTAWNPFFLKREEACGQQGTDVHDPSLSLPSRISEQAVPHLRGSTRCTPSLPRQGGSAESHRRARPCARRRAGGGGGGGKPGGRGSAEIRGSTPCKTNCPCTSADGVERGQGARHRVDRRRMPYGRCRMHGGMSPGAPKGNQNAFKHEHYTAEAIAIRRVFGCV